MPDSKKIEKRYIVQRKDGRYVIGTARMLMKAAAISYALKALGITFRDATIAMAVMNESTRDLSEVFRSLGEEIMSRTVEGINGFGLSLADLVFEMNAPRYRKKWLIILTVTMILLTFGIGIIY